MLHVKQSDSEEVKNIVVRGNDADIFVIFLTIAHHIKQHYGMMLGQTTTIQESLFALQISQKRYPMYNLWQEFMDFWGTAFYRNGKTRPIDIMAKSQRFSDLFRLFGQEELTDEMLAIAEEFVCHLYGKKKETNIDIVRRQNRYL